MSMGSLGGIAAGAAGSQLAQTTGSDVERAGQDTKSQQRRVQSKEKAESASGIGETDGEDHEAADRDADGRRLWEDTSGGKADDEGEAGSAKSSRQSKDGSGQSGNLLDLSG